MLPTLAGGRPSSSADIGVLYMVVGATACAWCYAFAPNPEGLRMAASRRVSESVSSSPFFRQMIATAPPDVFLACVLVYQNAAAMTMPVTNPQEYKVRVDEAVYAFTDRAENRGMLAVKDFLGSEQREHFLAVSNRIMALAGSMQRVHQEPHFKQFFRTDGADGSMNVSDALLRAFALADFKKQSLEIDLGSVRAHALRIEEEEGVDEQ
jgi:hypothetical protein